MLAAPAYSSEIAETKYRGALGTMMQLMVCCGILFINVNCSTDWRGSKIIHSAIFKLLLSSSISFEWSLYHISWFDGCMDDIYAKISRFSCVKRRC